MSSRKIAIFILISIAAAFCVGIVLLKLFWPFEPKPVIEALQEAGDSQVQARAFHKTYFPHPGCVLDGVAFIHDKNAAHPLISVEKLTIQSTYLLIFAKRLSLIRAEGLKISIPPFGSGAPFHARRSTIVISEMIGDGATLEFASADPKKAPLRFDIHEASLRDVGGTHALSYRLKVRNPEPPGEVEASGKFGVWNDNDPASTPISGQYTFERADLSVYGGIAGMLSSKGKFDGKLAHIDISGAVEVPDFSVKSAGHRVRLSTEYSAYVNATNGDTFLKRVDARLGKTQVTSEGSIAASDGKKGKTAKFYFACNNGRIEDILGLFAAQRAPMSGAVTLQANAELPPGERPFLEKLKLSGGFGIAGGKFSHSSTQKDVNKLSAGARGEKVGDKDDKNKADPETVLTDLNGEVSVARGAATFTDLSFGVPGAAARMHGTYGLINHKIDLHGQLQVDSKISNTSSGAKALFLKMMDPFFKKKNQGEILPVRISGTYDNPSFGLDPKDGKAKVAPPPQPKR